MYFAKKSLGALALVVGMMAFTATAYAQSVNESTSNVNTSSQQQATSSNEGVTAQVNSYGAERMHQSLNAQVPLSVVGYGSFSQSNCSNALGVGATTKIFSFVYNAPTPEKNCQHMVRSDAFGREAQLAHNQGKANQAEIMRALSVWQACTADEETTAACIRMGSIQYVDASKPDLRQTMPRPQFTDAAIQAPGTPVSSTAIPSRPAGWTSAELKSGAPSASVQDPRAADRGDLAVNSLPWVNRATR